MKRTKLFLTGMAALALSLGLLFTGCGDGGSDDPPPPPQETSITYKSTGTVGTSPGVAHTFILEIAESAGPGASIRAYTPKVNDTFTLYAGPTATFMQSKQTVAGTVGTPSDNAGVTTLTLTPDTGNPITVGIGSAGLASISGTIGTISISSALTLTPAQVEALTSVAVTFSGTEKSGSKLTATIDSTTPAGAAGFIDSYQWLRDGVAIPEANGLEYTLTTSDEGATLKLRVTALGYTGYADSDATGTIGAGFKLPQSTGYTVVGTTGGVNAATKVHYVANTKVLTYWTTEAKTETLLADTGLHKVLSGLSADDTFVVDAGGAISTVTFGTTAPDAAALTSVLDGVKAAGTVNLGAATTIDGDLTIPTGKTLDAKGVTVDIDHTGTDIVLTINGTLKSGTGSNIATLSGGVTITAGADEAALAASGAVVVDNTSNSIELAKDASIQLAGTATLAVGDSVDDVTFTLATITATDDGVVLAPDTTAGVVNIGGTSIGLGATGSIAATGAGVISAGDDTDKTVLVKAGITAPAGGDTVTASGAGVITVPKSTIAFDAAGSGTAAIIGNGALVVGSSTLEVRLEKALYTNNASGNATFAVGSTGVISLAATDTLDLGGGGVITTAGMGSLTAGATSFHGTGTWTAGLGSGVTDIRITSALTGATISLQGTPAASTLTASGASPTITQAAGTSNALVLPLLLTIDLNCTIAAGAAGTTVGSIVLKSSTTNNEGGSISFPGSGATAIIKVAKNSGASAAGSALTSTGAGAFNTTEASGKATISGIANVLIYPENTISDRVFHITGGTSAGTLTAFDGSSGDDFVLNAATAASG